MQQNMALAGLQVPDCIHFQIDSRRQIRATRVAELDELAQAIVAIDEDIGRLVQGAPALNYTHSDVEKLRQEKAALIELRERAPAGADALDRRPSLKRYSPMCRSRKRQQARGRKIRNGSRSERRLG